MKFEAEELSRAMRRSRCKGNEKEPDEKLDVSLQLCSIHLQHDDLKQRHGDHWDDPGVCDGEVNWRSMEFLDDLQQRFDAAMQY